MLDYRASGIENKQTSEAETVEFMNRIYEYAMLEIFTTYDS